VCTGTVQSKIAKSDFPDVSYLFLKHQLVKRIWYKSIGVFIGPHLIRRMNYFELAFARNPCKHSATYPYGTFHAHNY
jgi:hypothetical protein